MTLGMLRTTGVALLVAASQFALLAPADARRADVVRQGSCSARSDWKLKLHPDDGRIETEFQVDTPRAGQKWNVRIADNGTQVFARQVTTNTRSGSFTVEPRIPNRAGTDHIVATARNTVTGESCRGTASL